MYSANISKSSDFCGGWSFRKIFSMFQFFMEKVKERVPQKNSSNRIFAEVRCSEKKCYFLRRCAVPQKNVISMYSANISKSSDFCGGWSFRKIFSMFQFFMEKVKERVPQKNSSNRIFAEVRCSEKKCYFLRRCAVPQKNVISMYSANISKSSDSCGG